MLCGERVGIVDDRKVNKRKEKFYLEEFIKKSGLNIKILNDEREEPDFEICHDSSIKGMEIVDVLKDGCFRGGAPQKKLESFRSDIMAIARREYFSECQIPIEVKAFMATRLPKGTKGKNLVAQEIVNLLKSTDISSRQSVPTRVDGNDSIRFLVATCIPDGVDPSWICLNNVTGWSREVPKEVDNYICEKEKKLPKYRQAYKSVYLLLVVDSSYVSAMFHLPNFGNMQYPNSGFEKIYLYMYPDKILILR